MKFEFDSVGVIGAGGWGTALSILLSNRGYHVDLWVREEETRREILEVRTNSIFLPGVTIPRGVEPHTSLETVAGRNNLLLLPIPAQHMRSVVKELASFVTPGHIFVHCSKGIETRTLLRISQVIEEELPSFCRGRILVLSGPSHAEEVARGIPTAVVVAGSHLDLAVAVQNALMTPYFRIYTSADVIGVELGGALKNIIAIAAGISDGLGFGDNTKAALMTRGLAEIARLGIAMGASPLTFSGLSGLGDLIVTCTSGHSRNRWAGMEIGKGRKPEDVLGGTRMVVEGVPTTQAAYNLARKFGVEMPITESLYEVLFCGRNPQEAVVSLMTRGAKHEMAGLGFDCNNDGDRGGLGVSGRQKP